MMPTILIFSTLVMGMASLVLTLSLLGWALHFKIGENADF
jgi:hypothetical protein